MSEQEKKKNSGQFQEGNTIGKETRFKKNNSLSVKYKDEFCDRMEIFFSEQECKVIYEEEYFKEGGLKKRVPKMIIPQKYPTFEAFAVSIGVTSRTLREWAEVDENGKAKHPRFSAAYARAKEMQLAIAKNNGITKQYDSNFAKFVLINDHDMSDRVVQEQAQEAPFEVKKRRVWT